jgi:hypothetical protein
VEIEMTGYDYVGAALKPLGPITAILMMDGQAMVIDIERAPRSLYERLCLKGAMMRASHLVKSWKVVEPPIDRGGPMLALWFYEPFTGNGLAAFRAALGLRYRWHGRLTDQEGTYAAWVYVGTVDRDTYETQGLPTFDFAALKQIEGIQSVGWAPYYPRRVIDVETLPGYHILEVLQQVCAAADVFLDIENFHPPPDWDRRGRVRA